MKNKRVIFGFLLIILGGIWILGNLDIIDLNIGYIISGLMDLWPLILVVIGINIIVKNKGVKLAVWILFIVIIIVYSFFIGDNYNNSTVNEAYSIKMEDNIEKGELDIDVGATRFEVKSGSDDFTTISSNYRLDHETKTEGSTQYIDISNDNTSYFFNFFEKNEGSFVELDINESIPWEVEVDCGAVDGELNLEEIDIERLDLDVGAGNIEVTLGEKSDFTNINIDSGVSKIVLNIPKESGIRVKLYGGLNSTNLKELELIEEKEDFLVSKNFDDASTKYDINIDMGLGDFKINYY